MMLFDPWLRIGGATMLGLLVGSFLNVVIHRMPRMLAPPESGLSYNLARPRSHCPSCLHSLSWWQNLPLVSFCLQNGRCSACGVRISWRYPLVEALTALCYGFLAWRLEAPLALAGALWFSSVLIALAVIDFECGLLPDALTLSLLWSGLLFNLSGGPVSLAQAVLGAVCGYMALWLLYWCFRLLTGREGLGYGDFKLFAALGAWLGWTWLPQVLLLSSLTGLLAGGILMLSGRMAKGDPLPFGPFLALSGWVAWIFDARL